MSGGGTERTYGIWGFVALFFVLVAIGLTAVIIVPFPATPTVSIGAQTPNTVLTTVPLVDTTTSAVPPTDSSTTAPAVQTSAPAVTAPNGLGSMVSPGVTVPGGVAAPADVTQVSSSDGSLAFTFAVPAELAAGGDSVTTAVPPTRASSADDGNSIVVAVSCSTSSAEALAQVALTETDQQVTVVAVVLVPPAGPPCVPDARPRLVTMPLSRPLGDRQLLSAPAGAVVPGLAPA